MRALESLVLSAQLLGLSAPAPKPLDVPSPVLRLDLAEVQRDQDRAWQDLQVGAHAVGLTAAFNEQAGLVIKLRQAGVTLSYHQSALVGGKEIQLPRGRYKVWHENGIVRIFALDERGGGQLFAMDLVRSLYNAAVIVRLGVVDYAVVQGHDSISFLRRDDAGRYYVAYRPAARLARIEWLLAVNGLMYGVRLEGASLAFYSKPLPPVSPSA